MTRPVLAGCIFLPLTLLAGAFLLSALRSSRDQGAYPPPGRLIEVGDRTLHLHCLGQGSPTVVLESGAGGTVLDWSLVAPLIAEKTTVCAYDRAGLGWSAESRGPRPVEALVEEAHDLLTEAGLSPPFVLVGHSFGGLISQGLAMRLPESSVAGVVLVDSVHPALYERMPAGFADATSSQLGVLSIAARLAPTGLLRLLVPPLAPPGLPAEQ
ncbi:MAG: alpha/beta hydrolase, partial [Acidobacteriota bacterium]